MTSENKPQIQHAPDTPALDAMTTNKILNTALERNNMNPSSIPVEVLEEWGNYNRSSFRVAKKITYLLILLTLLLPLIVLKPAIVAERINVGSDTTAATYAISIKGIIPVRSVSAELDGKPLEVTKLSSKGYELTATSNGELVITATSINGQISTRTCEVNYLDMDKPEFLGSRAADGFIYIRVSDSFSGIDWDSLTGAEPVSIDRENGEFQIASPPEPVTVTVSDMAGNTLTMLVSP